MRLWLLNGDLGARSCSEQWPGRWCPSGSLSSTFGSLDAPSAQLTGDSVDSVVTGNGVYEADWPVGPDGVSLQAGPAVNRNTASSLGCRVVSRKALAVLLKTEATDEQNLCRSLNEKALSWATEHLPKHNVDRYNSDKPCNGCAKGVPVSFVDDKAASGDIADETLDYELGDDKLTVGSPSQVTDDEYSCMLLSTARAADFLLFDAFSASRYSDDNATATVMV